MAVPLRRRAGGGPHIEPQYRQYPQLTKKQKFESELISGAMWFWILWHLWHDPDAVFVSSRVKTTLMVCEWKLLIPGGTRVADSGICGLNAAVLVQGHFPWPDASQWTDEELGIPLDDEE